MPSDVALVTEGDRRDFPGSGILDYFARDGVTYDRFDLACGAIPVLQAAPYRLIIANLRIAPGTIEGVLARIFLNGVGNGYERIGLYTIQQIRQGTANKTNSLYVTSNFVEEVRGSAVKAGATGFFALIERRDYDRLVREVLTALSKH